MFVLLPTVEDVERYRAELRSLPVGTRVHQSLDEERIQQLAERLGEPYEQETLEDGRAVFRLYVRTGEDA